MYHILQFYLWNASYRQREGGTRRVQRAESHRRPTPAWPSARLLCPPTRRRKTCHSDHQPAEGHRAAATHRHHITKVYGTVRVLHIMSKKEHLQRVLLKPSDFTHIQWYDKTRKQLNLMNPTKVYGSSKALFSVHTKTCFLFSNLWLWPNEGSF